MYVARVGLCAYCVVPKANHARTALEWSGKLPHDARAGTPRGARWRLYDLCDAPSPLVTYKQSPDSFHSRWNLRPIAYGRGLFARTRFRLPVPCIMVHGHNLVYCVLELDDKCAQLASIHSR